MILSADKIKDDKVNHSSIFLNSAFSRGKYSRKCTGKPSSIKTMPTATVLLLKASTERPPAFSQVVAGHPSVELAMDSGVVTCCSLQPGVAIQESKDLNMLEDWLQLRPLPVSS